MNVELARQQWEDGRRRVEGAPAGSEASQRLSAEVALILAELRRRVGQTYTLAELAEAYGAAVEWARDVLHDARPDDAPPPETAIVVDAAFQVYARGASDYRP
jgi:hypothetical protein